MKKIIIQLKFCASFVLAMMVFCTLSVNKLSAQNAPVPLTMELQRLATPQSNANWIDFLESSSVRPKTMFTDLKRAFRLAFNDEMKLAKTESDELGLKHYRYQQYHKNVKVLFGEFIVHEKPDGFVSTANGRIVAGLQLENNPAVQEEQGLKSALSFVPAKKYLWQNKDIEADLKRKKNDNSATYFPKGELVYAPSKQESLFQASDYRLAWSYDINTDDKEVISQKVFVDAVTGKIIYNTPLSTNCSGGSGISTFNGTVPVYTQLNGGSYYSHNDCQATDIFVYDCEGGGPVNSLSYDADNNWNAPSQKSSVQAQWGAQMTYNYYYNQHNRQSWDGAAGDMIVYNNAYFGSNNAGWSFGSHTATFYAGSTSSPSDDWNTNDIMGHEFTHGVTQASAGLVYSGESGALNESFSDIFGEMVESWSEGNCDYLVGADRGAIRSFINPNSHSDPDTYLGSYWYTGTGDNGGVHTNSGVQNHWFYLLSEGGSGTTDFGVPYSVTGISRFKARLIAYRALTLYLTSSSQYIDARAATIHAAIDLYGSCSTEAIAVGDAWHAVGVESKSPQFVKNACGNYPANGYSLWAISTLTVANSCAAEITPTSSTVYFAARDKIIFYPGFKADNGSNFVAYIQPCASSLFKNGIDGVITSDAEKGIKPSISIAKSMTTANDLEDGFYVSPNPFTSNFSVSVNSNAEIKAHINIYNSIGIKMSEKADINFTKGLNKITFDGSGFAKGVYFVEIVTQNEKRIKKILK